MGAVGGYLRVSRIDFPPDCLTPDARTAHMEMLRKTRMAELSKDAALQGETITEWYDDLGVSGRGKFLPRRVAFARAWCDAKEGRLRVLYARDLSRLFRNVVQQELWFAEMEDLGITVHAQDLPFASDPATRRLLRQQMGIIHEYVSSRMGSLMRERMATRILNGLGMGLHRSKWGLTYNSACKAFDFDPATADKVRLVFETYVAMDGSAGQAAAELNSMLATGHPRATPTPHGNIWDHGAVLNLIHCQTYRRVIKYGAVCLPCFERIPEVVSPNLVAYVDALLIPRHQHFTAIHDLRKAAAARFTYSDLLRCGYCGGAMRSKPNLRNQGENGPNWVSYRCKAAAYGKGCPVNYTVQQSRLNVLVGQGLELAFQRFWELNPSGKPPDALRGERPDAIHGKPPDAIHGKPPDFVQEAKAAFPIHSSHSSRSLSVEGGNSAVHLEGDPAAHPTVSTDVDITGIANADITGSNADITGSNADITGSNADITGSTAAYLAGGTAQAFTAAACLAREKALHSLDQKRERYLELFAHGLIRDKQELEQCLFRVQQERRLLEVPRVLERDTSNAATRVGSAAEVARREAEFNSVWPPHWDQLLDVPKHNLLKRLRAAISVRIAPHTAKEPSKTGRHRLNGGRLTLTLELPALDLVGLRALHLAESEEQLEAYWQWRSSFLLRR